MRTGGGTLGTARRVGTGADGTALAAGGREVELVVGVKVLLKLRPIELKLLDGLPWAVEPAAGNLAFITLASD